MSDNNPFENLDPFLNLLKSDAPTPGGGAVAGLTGALAASLAHMVASLTVGKKKYESVDAEFRAAMIGMDASIGRFRELIEADVRVFDTYMAALRLPKSSDAEKVARKEAMLEAARDAARVPMETLEEAGHLLPLVRLAAEKGNAHAVSDAGMAAILVSATARSAALNVRINLSSMPADEAETWRNRLEETLSSVLEEAGAIETKVASSL